MAGRKIKNKCHECVIIMQHSEDCCESAVFMVGVLAHGVTKTTLGALILAIGWHKVSPKPRLVRSFWPLAGTRCHQNHA